uniref:PEGA domain protein n=1 Tax=Solibacter usitatus (strain Ellin6076) TaxID=234267 RepID=Q01TQ6_SOLUE
MNKFIIPTLLICVNLAAFAQEQQQILHEGTPVRMKISRTVSSGDAHQGDTVDFETLDDVKLGEMLLVPKGSVALATVTEAVPKKRMGRGGKLNVNIDFVRLPSGEKLALRGVQDVKGGGHTGAMTGAIVATSLVFFPAAPLFLFMHGKDITIPKGQEITVYTNTEYDLSKAKAATKMSGLSPEVPKSTLGPAIGNADILKLKEAGLNEQLIIEKVKASRAEYQLGTDDLVELKKAGISDGVIGAMLAASAR